MFGIEVVVDVKLNIDVVSIDVKLDVENVLVDVKNDPVL